MLKIRYTSKFKKDFKVIILSNSPKNRVRPFKEKLNIDSAFSSKKPFKKKYKKASIKKNADLQREAK